MIKLNIKYHCRVCGNSEFFYAMPCDKKVNENDFAVSIHDYMLRCQKCNQKYLLKWQITLL